MMFKQLISEISNSEPVLPLIALESDDIANSELGWYVAESNSATANVHCLRGFDERSPVRIHSPQTNWEYGCDSLLATISQTTRQFSIVWFECERRTSYKSNEANRLR
jgi:hypothetical protein